MKKIINLIRKIIQTIIQNKKAKERMKRMRDMDPFIYD